MTDELVEKVARAIAACEFADGNDEPWEPFIAHARAVIPLIYNQAIADAAAKIEDADPAFADLIRANAKP